MRKRNSTKAVAALASIALAGALVACGEDDSGDGGDSGGKKKVKTALVLPCPPSDPWCAQGLKAVKSLEKKGEIELKVTTSAPPDTAGVTRVLGQYAQSGSELILAQSTWQDSAFAVAKQYPDVNIGSFAFELRKNVAIFDEPIYQGAYLAGILAGGITKSNTIAGSAGQDVPLCHAELEAFEAGAKTVNKKIKMLDAYIGDWNDAAKAKQTSESQIDDGADVLIACGGGPAAGMAQAIKERDVSGFGYVGDTSSQAPKNIVGSVIYNLEPYYAQAVKDVRDDKFRPAKKYEFGMDEGGVDLQLNDQYSAGKIPPKVMSAMEKAKADIISGKLSVPFEGGT